jgi:hypothetical protein
MHDFPVSPCGRKSGPWELLFPQAATIVTPVFSSKRLLLNGGTRSRGKQTCAYVSRPRLKTRITSWRVPAANCRSAVWRNCSVTSSILTYSPQWCRSYRTVGVLECVLLKLCPDIRKDSVHSLIPNSNVRLSVAGIWPWFHRVIPARRSPFTSAYVTSVFPVLRTLTN